VSTGKPAVPVVHPNGTRVCGVADALQLIGDRWSLLVIRELEFGVHRFNDIQRLTGAPREALTARLRKLESVGVLQRRLYSSAPPRYEYQLTAAGRELRPALAELRAWGERHAGPLVQPPS
jgi:DNA-binding HxlR family transcriptional regulator